MQKKIILIQIYLFWAFFQLFSENLYANEEIYTYQLTQSTAQYQLWTTPPSERVFLDDAVPTETDANIKVYAAGNEFEPFQIVVNPNASGTLSITMGDFGHGIESRLYQVKYVPITQPSDSLGRTGPYPDPLWPLENGDMVSVTANENTAFWVDLHIPANTPSGDYLANVEIAGITIPVSLHLFNFSLPETPTVKSQMNLSHNTILTHYGVSCCGSAYWDYVDKIKQYFIDHRLTPKSVLWSGGITSSGAGPYIDYDCTSGVFTDNDGIWGFEKPAERYLQGTGLMDGKFIEAFNSGNGFPSFMAATFQNNDASADQRPTTFCGHTRTSADWYTANNPASAYNQAWFAYMNDLQGYLDAQGYLDRAYYYFANEPQDQADYDAVAWYAHQLKQSGVAPNLKLMVSEEPKPEIYNHPTWTDAKIDIWLPVLNNYDPVESHARETGYGEETWIYWLHGTRPPFFNPITLDHPGIEGKLTGWFLWKYRVRGIAYYSMNNWSKNPWTDPLNDNHNGDLFMLYPPSKTNTPISYGSNNHRFVPSIRFELMRDGLEDFEYLYIMNTNSRPQVGGITDVDTQVDKIIKGVASYTRNSEFIYTLRRLIGLYVGGEISSIPDIAPPVEHPRSEGAPENYYINFQDPYGTPATTYTEETYGNGYTYRYVTYADHDYLQVGTEEYDQTAGFGWLDDTDHFLTGRDPWGDETDERKITYVYDDYAHHPSVFEFDLPSGTYDVEVSVGTPRRVRSHNRVVIEGVSFIDDEPSDMYIVRSRQVTVNDSKLTVDVGIWDEYTMLDYLNIEAVVPPQGPVADFSADPTFGQAPLTVQFQDESAHDPDTWQWDFDNDGVIDSTEQNPSHTYSVPGVYSVKLTVSNAIGSDSVTKNNLVTVTGGERVPILTPVYLLLLN